LDSLNYLNNIFLITVPYCDTGRAWGNVKIGEMRQWRSDGRAINNQCPMPNSPYQYLLGTNAY
jgi:hypothetical protein